MSSFFIATVSIKNGEKFQEYAAKAKATFDDFNGEVIARGKHEGNFAGTSAHQAVGIVKFPSTEDMENWFNSDAYQAIIPLRNEAADMIITKYSVPAA